MITEDIVINEGYAGFNPLVFGEEKCEPAHSYGPALRDYWLLHYVVSGEGIFEDCNGRHKLKAGDVFVIRPNKETYYEADRENPWHYIWIGFSSDIPLPEAFENSVIRSRRIANIFEEMKQSRQFGNGKSAFLSGCIWKIVSVLLERRDEQPDYIEKALNYMRSDYMNDISVAHIAKILGLDRSYFSTLFCENVGMPPSKYLIKIRLERAAELMVVHNQTPSTAATSVGYPDIYHFSKVFKKYFGCAPREYCKKFANKTKSV